MLERGELGELAERGWRLGRDGSTATAHLAWDDPEDPESGWELLVLHTAGHGARFTLNVYGSGLTERDGGTAARLRVALGDVCRLLERWEGELPTP
jgi:hypothetical protein